VLEAALEMESPGQVELPSCVRRLGVLLALGLTNNLDCTCSNAGAQGKSVLGDESSGLGKTPSQRMLNWSPGWT